MVKPGSRMHIWIWTLLGLLPLSSQAQNNLGTLFRVNPAVCLAQEKQPCELTLSVEWVQPEKVCLYRADTEQLLECGQRQQLQLQINLDANLLLQMVQS